MQKLTLPIFLKLPRVGAVLLTTVTILLGGPYTQGQGRTDAFGSAQRDFTGTASFVGIFYDLKQSQTRQRYPNPNQQYWKVIRDFVSDEFNEAQLDRFFRAALPLYTNRIAMSNMAANNAPRAFGVQDVVEPRHWIIHYRAQVAPPRDGRYRLGGGSDDVLVAGINRKVVVIGQHADRDLALPRWVSPADPEPRPGVRPGLDNRALWGHWLDLKAGVPLDLDVVVGERPGGSFYAVLVYQEEGKTYPVRGERMYVPILELVPHDSPEAKTKPDAWHVFP